MKEAIEMRISRRTFEKQELTETEIQQLNTYITELNQLSELTMEWIEDGSDAFAHLTKSYGLFTNVRSLILMKGQKKDANLKEKVGYYGEELVLRLTNLGLGTCWVGGTFDKETFKIKDTEKLICVIVVGKIKNETIKEKMIRNAMSKNRKTIAERLITDIKQLPSWLEDGLEAVRLAPSAKNSQKVTFEYKNGILTARVPDDYEFDLVDLGIAKKHFELVTNGTFDLGNGSTFQLDKKRNKER